MNELTSAILSSAIWEALKKGIVISKDFLKKKLTQWTLDEKELKKIADYVNNTPEVYRKSEELLREYINLDEEILTILKNVKPTCTVIEQNFQNYSGIAIGVMNGGKVENKSINITQYSSKEPPKNTSNKPLDLTTEFTKYKPVQLVKSFSYTRDNCTVNRNSTPSVCSDIYIPNSAREKERCSFAMILFAFIPPKNLINYFDENYSLQFELKTSDSIKQVQLQIKNSKIHQFIDIPIKDGYFSCPLSEMSNRDAWNDIQEICFTIFADDEYIVGEYGTIKISGLKLSK